VVIVIQDLNFTENLREIVSFSKIYDALKSGGFAAITPGRYLSFLGFS
jgi:hypothetical protein